MSFSLWIRIFLFQLITLLIIILSLLQTVIYIIPEMTWDLIFQINILGFSLPTIATALVLTLSVIIATFLSVMVFKPFEDIRARLNWLVIGKYKHAIFSQSITHSQQFQDIHEIDRSIHQLRNELQQLSKDLQEFTATPTFVGELTREEIIENERNRIARELHDSVSQQLFAAMMLTSALEQMSVKEDNSLTKQISQIEQIISNAQTEMRALLLHLRPIDLADQSLDEGIDNLLTELSTKVPMEIKWNLTPTTLESGIEDHLFRIVQEAISNAMRHSKAKMLEVILNQSDDFLSLKVKDDGIGFDVNEALHKGNYGLRNMTERTKSMGGNINIMSSPNQGTIIDIQLPVSTGG